jgi:HD-like signal output (HDOD) protein
VDFDLRGFWRDSLAVAHASRLAASASRKGSPDEHFSAGLLHGIGKLVEYQHLRPQLRRILAEVRGTGVPWDQAERRLLGTTYAEIGGALCERWRFPASIAEAARRHLDPPAALADPAVPREALVVGAARALLASRREPELLGAWSPLLHVPADRLPGLLDEASGLAATGVGEIFPA